MLKPGIKLTSYQQEFLAFASNKSGVCAWHSVGSGKTLSSLAWALAAPGPVLYLTTAAARYTALAEIEKWTTCKAQLLTGENPYYRKERVYGQKEVWEKYRGPSERTGREVWLKRRSIKQTSSIQEVEIEFSQILDSQASVFICTYEILPYWQPFLERLLPKPFSLVFSEIHRLKGQKRQGPTDNKLHGNLAWAAKRISLAAARRLGETGTPIRDRPRDLWAEIDLVCPGYLGRWWNFALEHCGATRNQYGGMDTKGATRLPELRAKLDAVVHRVSAAEILKSLPPVRRNVLRIAAGDLDHKVAVDSIKSAGYRPHGLAAKLAAAATMKRSAVGDLLAGLLDPDSCMGKGKVLVFTYLRQDCEVLAKELAAKLDCPVLMGHGGMSNEERTRLQTQYMASEQPIVLVGTIDSYGESKNLQDTDHLVLAGLPFTPGQLEQAEGRVRRKGMDRPVTIHYLVASGTADESVANMLLSKLPATEELTAVGGLGDAGKALEDAIGLNDEKLEEELLAMILGLED